jgi:hypothetical protein
MYTLLKTLSQQNRTYMAISEVHVAACIDRERDIGGKLSHIQACGFASSPNIANLPFILA